MTHFLQIRIGEVVHRKQMKEQPRSFRLLGTLIVYVACSSECLVTQILAMCPLHVSLVTETRRKTDKFIFCIRISGTCS
jgi:hypothetical protein